MSKSVKWYEVTTSPKCSSMEAAPQCFGRSRLRRAIKFNVDFEQSETIAARYRGFLGAGTPSCLQMVRTKPGPISLCRGSADTWSCGPRHFACLVPPTSWQPWDWIWRSKSRRFTLRQ